MRLIFIYFYLSSSSNLLICYAYQIGTFDHKLLLKRFDGIVDLLLEKIIPSIEMFEFSIVNSRNTDNIQTSTDDCFELN